MKSRQPDYDLSYLNKSTNEKGRIGVGWENDNGSISVKLNVLVRLESDPDMVLTLFPRNKRQEPIDDCEHEAPF